MRLSKQIPASPAWCHMGFNLKLMNSSAGRSCPVVPGLESDWPLLLLGKNLWAAYDPSKEHTKHVQLAVLDGLGILWGRLSAKFIVRRLRITVTLSHTIYSFMASWCLVMLHESSHNYLPLPSAPWVAHQQNQHLSSKWCHRQPIMSQTGIYCMSALQIHKKDQKSVQNMCLHAPRHCGGWMFSRLHSSWLISKTLKQTAGEFKVNPNNHYHFLPKGG